MIVIVVPSRVVTSVDSNGDIGAFVRGFLEEAAVTGEVTLGLPRLRRRIHEGYATLIPEVPDARLVRPIAS
jgi:hypothetical protein